MLTVEEFEDYIYSDDADFDIDTWSDIKFVACQEFLVEYINKQLTQKDVTIGDLNITNVIQDKKINRQGAIIKDLKRDKQRLQKSEFFLEQENEKLGSLLLEACSVINSSLKSKHHEDFLNKPEIKQLLNKGINNEQRKRVCNFTRS